MSWLDGLMVAIYVLGAMILLLWLYNLVRALRQRSDCVPVRRLMYCLAIAAVALSIARSSQLYGSTVVFANLIALLCIIAAFARSERKPGDRHTTE